MASKAKKFLQRIDGIFSTNKIRPPLEAISGILPAIISMDEPESPILCSKTTATIAIKSVATTASSSSTANSSDSEDENDPLWWGPTPNIDQGLICRLAKRLVGDRFGDKCWVQEKHAGSYNRVYIIMFDNGAKGDGSDCSKVALKVPAAGWAPQWCSTDAIYLRSEALTLRYIHEQCGDDFRFVPKMIAYDTTFDNEINAPFLLMSHLGGRTAYEIWGFAGHEVSEAREWPVCSDTRRSNLHTSLARTMAKLKRIEFPAIGLPDYLDDELLRPRIQSEFAFSVLDLEDDQSQNNDHVPHQRRNWTEVQTFPSTAKFFGYHLKQAMKREKFGEFPDEVGKDILVRLIHKVIPASRPTFLAVNLPETFSLSHNDLDLQNILCDDYGNVTGIVDWEGCTARPHHLGWAATPKWLRSEWEADYNWPFDKSSLSPVQIQQYRQEYTTALEIETPETWRPGPSYPSMSHLTCSLYEACTFGNLDSWCNRFLHEILPCLDSQEFFVQLGKAKAWAPIIQGPIQGEKLNSWLEDRVLEWYFRYGRSSEWLEATGFFDTKEDDSTASSVTSTQSDGGSTSSIIEDDQGTQCQVLSKSQVSRPGTPDAVSTALSSSSPRTQKQVEAPGKPDAVIVTQGQQGSVILSKAIPEVCITQIHYVPSQNSPTQEEAVLTKTEIPPPPPSQSLDVGDSIKELITSLATLSDETIEGLGMLSSAIPKATITEAQPSPRISTAHEEAVIIELSKPLPSPSQALDTGIMTKVKDIVPPSNIYKPDGIAPAITGVTRLASAKLEANRVLSLQKAVLVKTRKSTVSTQVLEPIAPEPCPANIAEALSYPGTTQSTDVAIAELCASVPTDEAEEYVSGEKVGKSKTKFRKVKVMFGRGLRTILRRG